MNRIELTKKELKKWAKEGRICAIEGNKCPACDGECRVYYIRSCAEDDPTGWYTCERCKGSGYVEEYLQVVLVKEEKSD